MIFERVRRWLARRVGGRDVGAWGERVAEAYLCRECRFTLIGRNWRNPADAREEIDLVMRDGPALVFVEVKARSARALVPGYFAAVTTKKKRVLRRACAAYLRGIRPRPTTFRFDVVEVEVPAGSEGARPVLRHFANVPLFAKDFRF
ncbi:MAG TPA: YraN family protein [Candidatus Synoicihabitans sp.]|nr:YraN family protein [Candidatus Synoicihabitans sp.]